MAKHKSTLYLRQTIFLSSLYAVKKSGTLFCIWLLGDAKPYKVLGFLWAMEKSIQLSIIHAKCLRLPTSKLVCSTFYGIF